MSASQKRGQIDIQNLQVTFERWGNKIQALNNVSMTVPAGQWLMLVGPNGSGKSTILKTMSGRLKPDNGGVRIDGSSIVGMNAEQLSNAVFLVHQDPLLGSAPLLTVYENMLVADNKLHAQNADLTDIVLPVDAVETSFSFVRILQVIRRLRGNKKLEEKYSNLLKPYGLDSRLKQPVKTLSGGERQLLALLIAGLRPSSVILLDEPLAALDPEKTEQCIEQIRALHRQGRTIIQVTHDEELTATLGDRTVALRNGEVVFDETDKETRQKVNTRSR